MAIDGIGLSEPSTITKSLAAVPITRNSSVTYQEVMVLGSPNSTTAVALAEVLGSVPASTTVGLVTRPIGPVVVAQSTAGDLNVTVANFSTTVAVSSIVGPVTVRSSAANLLASVYQSTAADLNVTVAGYSTTVNVSSLGGAVIVRSSAADFKASVYQSTVGDLRAAVYQSTAADLNVTVAGYSTTVAVSSVGGAVIVRSSAANALVSVYQSTATDLSAQVQPIAGSTWRTQPGSTAWASSAGFHFDSSGALLISGASASTGVTVNRIVGNSSAADAVPVRIVLADGSTYVSPAVDYTHSGAVTASTVTGPAVMLYASSAAPSSVTDGDMVLQWATQRGAANVAHVTSSGADMSDSTNTALRVNVVAGSAASTTVNVSSLGGAVIVRSSKADALVTVYQSTATDLLARVNQGVGISTLADRWLVNVANSSAADFIGVRLVDSSGTGFYGPTKPQPIAVTDSSNAVVKPGDSANNALRVNVVAGAAAGSTAVTVSQLLDSSGGSITAGDSANQALRVNVVAGAAGGSTLVTVRQSTYTDFNTLSRLADRDQSTQVAAVLGTGAPASTAYGLVVRVAEPSTGPFVVSSIVGPVTVRSSAANFLATMYQSTAADLNVTVAGYSTTVAVSSLGGAVIVRSSAANALVSVYQSTASELQATVRINTSSGGAVEGSTTAPAPGAIGLHTRPIFPTMNSTTLVITSTHSTAIYPVISSVAGLRHKVYAYFISSTHTVPSTLIFCSSASGSGFDHWHVGFGSGSSGMTGANLALTPPGYIFAGLSQNALNVKIEGGSSVTSTVIARVSIAWFDEA